MTKHPIPDAALDDRLALVGTSGSGKTHTACTCVERLLHLKARVVVVDPLDVWYGLRLKADGVMPGFPVVVFGGAHGDLPITEHSGSLIGETVATMAESCIVSLGGLGSKSAERRFMLAFLESLYRNATKEPVHLIFDEADLWAPQRTSEPQLQNLMEQIVRRGRVKGFIPYLITQRPAVLSKDVLSQADGLIAMKLTSSQDRDAIGAWIEGQADRADEKKMLARLPQLERGSGVVWIPGRAILKEAQFPARETFDSSRTPKRGEAVRSAALKPIDLGAVKERLASIEVETAANDPKKLKAEIAALKRQVAAGGGAPDPGALRVAEERGFERGGEVVRAAIAEAVADWPDALAAAMADTIRERTNRLMQLVGLVPRQPQISRPSAASAGRSGPTAPVAPTRPAQRQAAQRANGNGAGAHAELTGPERTFLASVAWWKVVAGNDKPTRAQVCAIAGWRVTSGHVKNVAGSLRTKGLIDYPSDGRIRFAPGGEAVADAPDDTGRPVASYVRETLSGPQQQVFDELLRHPHGLAREALCDAIGWSVASGHVKNVLGSLRSMEVVEYPTQGSAKLADWILQ